MGRILKGLLGCVFSLLFFWIILTSFVIKIAIIIRSIAAIVYWTAGLCRNGFSVGQGVGQGPPQSMSASPWFWILSVQVGQGWQGPPQSINNSQEPS